MLPRFALLRCGATRWGAMVFLAWCASCASPTPAEAPRPPSLEPPGAEAAPSPEPIDQLEPPSSIGAETQPELTGEAAPEPDGRPRIGSVRWYTYFWEQPSRPKGTMAIGGLRIGTSVALKSKEPVPGGDCKGKWYAIEPHGFVCTDETTTFDLDSAYFKALASLAPSPGAYPYRYAFSTGAPMYSRVPTEAEQAEAEMTGFGPRKTFTSLGKWSEGHEWLVDKDASHEIAAADEPPPFIKGNEPIAGSPWHPHNPKVRVIPAGSAFSYARAFKASGRTWLLTPDLFLVPADRAFAYKPAAFRGVELKDGVDLPLAWIRSQAGEKKLRRGDGGAFVEAGDSWGNKSFVLLTGRTEQVGKVTFHETREAGDLWLAETSGVSVVTRVASPHQAIGKDEKWIEARLLPGTMTAYVGTRPLWTTLWSGGRGGVPVRGHDPKRYATTELGVFSFQWKDKVATMSPDAGAPTVFWFADVPNIQYVKAPLAMHVAYWHDNFGHLMSAECLNISPEDGEWLFGFTDPPLPPGWGSVRPSPSNGPSTRVHIKAY